jgi:hypothetical protein
MVAISVSYPKVPNLNIGSANRYRDEVFGDFLRPSKQVLEEYIHIRHTSLASTTLPINPLTL